MTNPKQTLQCHFATPCPFLITLSSQAFFLDDGALQLHYHLQGTLDNLCIPLQSKPIQTDNLWQHTCFEAFISTEKTTAYYEYNFSPSQQWAIYSFKDYRQVIPYQPQTTPLIEVTQTAHQLTLKITLSASLLPPQLTRKNSQLGLTAVIEHQDLNLSYWALKHPLATPDFHHQEGFIHTVK